MQALVFNNRTLTFEPALPTPSAGDGEAVIKVTLAGICATDLEIVKGYMGFSGIPGHEFVGRVETHPNRQWIGKRVVGSINAGCGECQTCAQHGPEHCAQSTVLGIAGRNGAFAQKLQLPVENLFEVPSQVTDEQAVFTEPLAAALRIAVQVPFRPNSRVAIVGPGRLGLLIGLVLTEKGQQVTMLGRSQSSLDRLRHMHLHGALVEEQPDNSFDYVVEATGNQAGFEHSLRLVRPLGAIILKSTFASSSNLDLTKIVVGEITVIGSRCGPFAPALRLLARRAFDTAPLIEARYALSDGVAAFAHAARPGAGKILLVP